MFCLLARARYFPVQSAVLAWQRSLVTPVAGRQGASKHKWRINVLSHNLHLL